MRPASTGRIRFQSVISLGRRRITVSLFPEELHALPVAARARGGRGGVVCAVFEVITRIAAIVEHLLAAGAAVNPRFDLSGASVVNDVDPLVNAPTTGRDDFLIVAAQRA